MVFSFNKVDMSTGSGFVLDSFEAQQARFVAVTSEEDFGADFLDGFRKALGEVTGPGAALRRGAVEQVTTKLYAEMDAVRPWLAKLEVRLDLVDAGQLTVPVKSFGLSKLRRRLDVRDAEGVGALLQQLNKAVAANLAVLTPRGHQPADTAALVQAEERIAALNRQQNDGQNQAVIGTEEENKLLRTLDEYVKKVLKAGRKLFRGEPEVRRQFQRTGIMVRMNAGEKPKRRDDDGQALE